MAFEQTRVDLRAHPGLVTGRWQSPVLLLFLAVNLAHVTEHVLQVIQIFALGWPRSQALGALGLVWPWLVRSEWLHYWYAPVILVGLIALRPALTGRARAWWDVALAIQIWHHVEHALLLGQVLARHNLFGAAVPQVCYNSSFRVSSSIWLTTRRFQSRWVLPFTSMSSDRGWARVTISLRCENCS